MKKEITVGQLVSACITILVAIFGWAVAVNNFKSKQEEKNLKYESEIYNLRLEVAKQNDKLENKVDDIQSTTTEIKIMLERKQDRK